MKYKKSTQSNEALRVYIKKKEVLLTEFDDGTVIVECETNSGTVDVRITWNPKRQKWHINRLQRSEEIEKQYSKKMETITMNPSRRKNP